MPTPSQLVEKWKTEAARLREEKDIPDWHAGTHTQRFMTLEHCAAALRKALEETEPKRDTKADNRIRQLRAILEKGDLTRDWRTILEGECRLIEKGTD